MSDTEQIRVPVFKCHRLKDRTDGTEIFGFACDKCGEIRTHSPENGYRVSHCGPDCWPDGYILEEIIVPPKKHEYRTIEKHA